MSDEVRDNPARSRYEIEADGQLAGIAEYRLHGGLADFTHTKVDDDFEGRGLGSRLIRGALDDVRARGLQVLPHCPFVRAFIAKNDEYLELVPAERRAEFDLAA
jgi:predicted GNAT family acetyltransferase